MANNYLKQCAAWATAWWERFANKVVTRLFAKQIYEGQKLFISNVAHELRTPLSTIKTSTEVALIDTGLSRDARATFVEIMGELERISEIINNLLSLNTLTRPEHMHFKSLDLLPVAEAVIARHKNLARERGIRLRLKATPGSLAWANVTAVEQIMTNVVKNALSYTPAASQGQVVVTVRPEAPQKPEDEAMILFRVEDTGVGISQEDLLHIFEPFYRADNSRTRAIKQTGAGLGLTIVNEMVRAHRGKIHIESRKRHGTTVSVLLPQGGAARTGAEATLDFSKPSAAL